MAFFSQAQRNTDFALKNNPSPCQYNMGHRKDKLYGYAPFGSTSKIDRNLKKSLVQEVAQDKLEERIKSIEEGIFNKDVKMNSMFKSRSQRFIIDGKEVPGPGSYEVRNKSRSIKGHRVKMNVSLSDSIVKHPITNPSMPSDNLGYKFDQQQNLEKVKPKQTRVPIPGSYELRKDLNRTNGLVWRKQRVSKKETGNLQPGPGQYTVKNSDKQTISARNQTIRFKKPGIASYCFESKTSRFDSKTFKRSNIPGPGQYNPDAKIYRQLSSTHFNSKQTRFRPSKQDDIGPGSYHPDRPRAISNLKYEPSREPVQTLCRNTLFSNHNDNPGPGEYIARDGMTFELQKALLKKHNASQFPNKQRELFEQKFNDEPGPGAYNPQIPQSTVKHNLGYKKAQVVNLKDNEEQQITPSPFNYSCNQHTIQRRIEQSRRRITLVEKKPFNSGAQRFKHYANATVTKLPQRHMTHDTDNQSVETDHRSIGNFNDTRYTKKLIMTSVKVKVPFGSSSSKYPGSEATNVCPGYYQSSSGTWVKPTFSIKGKLVKH